jgi:hypothetical protein
VDITKLLPKSKKGLNLDYERQQPTVIHLTPFENGTQDVKSGLTKIAISFSEPLAKISFNRFFGEDGKTRTFAADLKPNQHYQIFIENNFRSENGRRLKPFLIDFKTTD